MTTSPTQYTEDAFVSDANFKVEINKKMKVPETISFNTEMNGMNHGRAWNKESSGGINMHVPERILVAGQNQHVGTRAPPREIIYDNSILPTEPKPEVRVATPPRSLTLDKYPFPGIQRDPDSCESESDNEIDRVSGRTSEGQKSTAQPNLSTTLLNDSSGIFEQLTPAEELQHLRKQMVKLNRRIMAVELENFKRLQKEKIIFGVGVAYFMLKIILWINRQ